MWLWALLGCLMYECSSCCLLQVLLMFGPEYARACGAGALEPLGIALPDKNYPGEARRKGYLGRH